MITEENSNNNSNANSMINIVYSEIFKKFEHNCNEEKTEGKFLTTIDLSKILNIKILSFNDINVDLDYKTNSENNQKYLSNLHIKGDKAISFIGIASVSIDFNVTNIVIPTNEQNLLLKKYDELIDYVKDEGNEVSFNKCNISKGIFPGYIFKNDCIKNLGPEKLK